jgi:hypothetical protein
MSNATGYGELTVLNESTILWEHKSSANGTVIDYLYLSKDSGHSFNALEIPKGFIQ